MLFLPGRQRGSESLSPEIRTASAAAGVQRRGQLAFRGQKNRVRTGKWKRGKGTKHVGSERPYFHFNVYIKIDVVLLIFICLFVI